MAASLGTHTKLTLTLPRQFLQQCTQRGFSSCRTCLGNTWHIHAKPRRLREINFAPTVRPARPKDDVQDIKVPNKIERGPTAVLEALASTVRNDVNQPVYLSIDDPHMYLTSDRGKKAYFAAKESGRKAARLMLSKYPEYFSQIWEEPLPDSLWHFPESYKHKEPSEEALLERIARLNVGEAISVYKALQAQKQSLRQETQERLLELLTVFNCRNQETVSELAGYVDNVSATLKHDTTMPACSWKKNNMAEQLFNSLPEKTAKAYCNMIRGMATNNYKEGALAMYSEMKAANLTADVYTYNCLLSVASMDTESMDDVIQFVEMIMKDMVTFKVTPDVETFNSIICNCRRLSRWRGSRAYALSVISEMKACGIEPSFGTYKELLDIFFYVKDKKIRSPELFEQILQELEGKELLCNTERDFLFFRSAMRVVAVHLQDSKLAMKIHKLLKTGKNHELLGHRQLQYAYYMDFFSIIIPLEHMDTVMEFYKSVVPFIFMPPSTIYKAMFESIVMHDCYGHIPQLYADLQWSPMFIDQDFIEPFAELIAKKKHEPQLQSVFSDIASFLINSWTVRIERQFRDIPYIDGSIIGHFISVYMNNEEFSKARELFQLYLTDKHIQRRDLSEDSLNRLADHLIGEQDYTLLKKVFELMLDAGYSSLSPLVEKAMQSLQLSDQERNFLKGLAAEVSSSSSSDSESE